MFVMEIWETNEIQPTSNVTLTRGPPVFTFEGIKAGVEYELRLYAINQKGRSEPVTLRTSSLKGTAMFEYTSKYIFFTFKADLLFFHRHRLANLNP